MAFASNFQNRNSLTLYSNGVMPTFTTPQTLFDAGRAARAAFGPVSQSVVVPGSSVLATPIANAIIGGREEVDGSTTAEQLDEITIKVRFRSWPSAYGMTYVHGMSAFACLKDTASRDDMTVCASMPLLNMLHRQRAYAEARALAGEEADVMQLSLGVLRNLTAQSPAEFAQLWAMFGELNEPSPSNTVATEQMWGVVVRGKGHSHVRNCFGLNVKLGDYLFFVCSLEPLPFNVDNPHAPQPKSVLVVRGCSSTTMPARSTSKTATPNPGDVDTIQRDARIKLTWREPTYKKENPPLSRVVLEDKPANFGLGEQIGSIGRVDLYQNGFTMLVGIATDQLVKNPPADRLAAAQHSIEAYNLLPVIGITPLQRRA